MDNRGGGPRFAKLVLAVGDPDVTNLLATGQLHTQKSDLKVGGTHKVASAQR